MTSPQAYRDFATDCLHSAAQSHDPADKRTMRDLARTWMCTALIAEYAADGNEPRDTGRASPDQQQT